MNKLSRLQGARTHSLYSPPGDDRFAQYDHEKPNIYDYKALWKLQKLRKLRSESEMRKKLRSSLQSSTQPAYKGIVPGMLPWRITPFQRGESDPARQMLLELKNYRYYNIYWGPKTQANTDNPLTLKNSSRRLA